MDLTKWPQSVIIPLSSKASTVLLLLQFWINYKSSKIFRVESKTNGQPKSPTERESCYLMGASVSEAEQSQVVS